MLMLPLRLPFLFISLPFLFNSVAIANLEILKQLYYGIEVCILPSLGLRTGIGEVSLSFCFSAHRYHA